MVQPLDRGLALVADGEDAYALLNPAPPGQVDAYRTLSARSADLAGHAFKKDYLPLHQAFADRLSLERIQAMEEEIMQDRQSRLGAYRGFAVLGTEPGHDGSAVTSLRVDFEKASVFNRYIWEGGILRGIQNQPSLPPHRFVPISASEIVCWSLTEARAQKAAFGADRDGRPVLSLVAPTGPVVASKEQAATKTTPGARRE